MEDPASSRPRLSVIVPVYNSPDDLAECLSALAQSDYGNFDVLVVDDGSTDPVEPIVADRGFRCVRIDGPGGPARARNRGALAAAGEYLVFVDADVCVHTDTLTRIAEAFRSDPTIDAVVGTYDDRPGDRGFISQYKNLFHHYVHQRCDGAISTFWAGCGAIRRDLYLTVGGFDEQRYRRPSIEDIELGTWLSAAGYRIVLDGGILCKHLKRWTLYSLLKTDVLDRGIPWTRLMHRAGEFAATLNVTWNQRLSVALVYSTPAALTATIWTPWAWPAAAGLFAAVTLLNFDFYRFFARRKGWWFTARVVPLHWLYFIYCGVCVVAGTVLHYSRPDRRPRPEFLANVDPTGAERLD